MASPSVPSVICHVEADQLAPAQRFREAEQEKRPIPTPWRVGSGSFEHRTQLGHPEQAHSALGDPEDPTLA